MTRILLDDINIKKDSFYLERCTMKNFPSFKQFLQENNTRYNNTQFNIIKIMALYNKRMNFYLDDITPAKMIPVWYHGKAAPKGLVKLPKPDLTKDILDKIFILYDFSKTDKTYYTNIAQAIINIIIFEYWFGDKMESYYILTDIIKEWDSVKEPIEEIIKEWNDLKHPVRNCLFDIQAQDFYRIIYDEYTRDMFLQEIKK